MTRRELVELMASWITAVWREHPVRVAINGVDTAGKSTFADELAPAIEALGRPVVRASIDDFPNPAAARYQRGRMSPEGYYRDSFDHRGLIDALLSPLGPGGSRAYRRAIRDIRTDEAVDAPIEHAPADAVLLLDGVFLLPPELRWYWDFAVFLDVDFDVVIRRAIERDVGRLGDSQQVKQRYEQRYIPSQRLYLDEVQPMELVHVVIDNNDPRRPRLIKPIT